MHSPWHNEDDKLIRFDFCLQPSALGAFSLLSVFLQGPLLIVQLSSYRFHLPLAEFILDLLLLAFIVAEAVTGFLAYRQISVVHAKKMFSTLQIDAMEHKKATWKCMKNSGIRQKRQYLFGANDPLIDRLYQPVPVTDFSCFRKSSHSSKKKYFQASLTISKNVFNVTATCRTIF